MRHPRIFQRLQVAKQRPSTDAQPVRKVVGRRRRLGLHQRDQLDEPVDPGDAHLAPTPGYTTTARGSS
jgi:hypothetical protein